MSHDHIGLPKFIQKGFADEKTAYVYDTIRSKFYSISIDRLGTENNYYDEDVEKEILANGIENNFSKFYSDFCCETDPKIMKELLDLNKTLVEQFFSYMFLRSKIILNNVNIESITSKLFGDLDHSELLRIQTIIQSNPLEIIGDKYSLFPVINYSETLFLNNSIGFGFLINKEKECSLIIPLNAKKAVLISGCKELLDFDYFYIEPLSVYKVSRINECMIRTEKVMGNGFFFGSDKELVLKYKDYQIKY